MVAFEELRDKCGECLIRLVASDDEAWYEYGAIIKKIFGLSDFIEQRVGLLEGTAWVDGVRSVVGEIHNNWKESIFDRRRGWKRHGGLSWKWLEREIESGKGEWEGIRDEELLWIVKKGLDRKVGARRWKVIVGRVAGGFRRPGKALANLEVLLRADMKRSLRLRQEGVTASGDNVSDPAKFAGEIRSMVSLRRFRNILETNQAVSKDGQWSEYEYRVILNGLKDFTLGLREYGRILSFVEIAERAEELHFDKMKEHVNEISRTHSPEVDPESKEIPLGRCPYPEEVFFTRLLGEPLPELSAKAFNCRLCENIECAIDDPLNEALTALMQHSDELLCVSGGRKGKENALETIPDITKQLQALAQRCPMLMGSRAGRIASVGVTLLTGLEHRNSIYKKPNITILISLTDILTVLSHSFPVDTHACVTEFVFESLNLALDEGREVNGIQENSELSTLCTRSLILLNRFPIKSFAPHIDELVRRLKVFRETLRESNEALEHLENFLRIVEVEL